VNPLLILGLFAGAGSLAYAQRKGSGAGNLQLADLPDQGVFFRGVSALGENVWTYEQDDGMTAYVLEPPRFSGPNDEALEAWYVQSAFSEVLPIQIFQDRASVDARGLYVMSPKGGIWAAQIGPSGQQAHQVEGQLVRLVPGEEGEDLDEGVFAGFVGTLPAPVVQESFFDTLRKM
jgi:hypothetical protein